MKFGYYHNQLGGYMTESLTFEQLKQRGFDIDGVILKCNDEVEAYKSIPIAVEDFLVDNFPTHKDECLSGVFEITIETTNNTDMTYIRKLLRTKL